MTRHRWRGWIRIPRRAREERWIPDPRVKLGAGKSGMTVGMVRGEVALPGVSGAKLRKITPSESITSLVLGFEPPHVVLGNNAAKGGDPMSHGSAKGSEKFVREMRF